MSPLVRELLVNGLLAGAAVRSAKKSSSTAIFYMLAAALGFLGVVFFAIAGHAYLLQTLSASSAAAITGAVITALSVLSACGVYIAANHRKIVRKNTLSERGFVDNIEHTIKGVFENFEEPVKDNPKMALLMAALAGFAAGDQLGDRLH